MCHSVSGAVGGALRAASVVALGSLTGCDSSATTNGEWREPDHQRSPVPVVDGPMRLDPTPVVVTELPLPGPFEPPPDPECRHATGGWMCFVYDDIAAGAEATRDGELAVLGNAAANFFDAAGTWVDRLEVPPSVGSSRIMLDFTLQDDVIAWGGEECGADAAYAPAEPQNTPYGDYCASAVYGALETTGAPLGTWAFGTRGGIDRVSSLSPAPDGELYVAGQYAAPLSLPGLEPRPSAGGIDLYLMRSTAAGGVRWATTWGSWDDDGDGPQVVTTHDGGAVVASHPDHAVVIGRLGPEGEERFRYELGGNASAFGIAIDADDNVYVAGIERPRGYLLSLDPDGNLRWRRDYGEASGSVERVIAVDVDAEGNVWAHGALEPDTVPAPPSSAWVRRLSRDGEELWLHRWEGLVPGLRHSVVGLGDGRVAVAGRMHGPSDMGLFAAAVAPSRAGASFLMVLRGGAR